MKRKFGKRTLILFLGVIFFVALSANAGATLVSYVDDGEYKPSAEGNTITYQLDFNLVSGNLYHAELTITTTANTNTEWYAGWFAFKFGPKEVTISDLSLDPINWAIGEDGTKVNWVPLENRDKTIKPFKSSWAGFYATDLFGSDAETYAGLLLTDNPITYTIDFDFLLAEGESVYGDQAEMKIGFYSNPEIDQFSETLTMVMVPEPTTMVLLGSALIGLGLLGRRKFKI